MILGLGTDVVNISRIEVSLEQFGDRFLSRILTPEEIVNVKTFPSHNKRAKAAYVAKRFAAKEAAAKALGTGFHDGVSFQDFSIHNDNKGKPVLTFSGRALELLEQYDKQTKNLEIHLSLSDDYPSAFAVVILSKRLG